VNPRVYLEEYNMSIWGTTSDYFRQWDSVCMLAGEAVVRGNRD